MSHLTTSLVAAFAASLLLGPASAQSSNTMKPTAMEKMMPPDKVKKMRDCEKQAKEEKIKMEDRSKFVLDCMGK